MRCNDLHFENIRSTSDGPIILDTKCILHFGPKMRQKRRSPGLIIEGQKATVLGPRILPSWGMSNTVAGPHDITALGNYVHADRQPATRRIEMDGPTPRWVYERRLQNAPMPHQPVPSTMTKYRQIILYSSRVTRVVFWCNRDGILPRYSRT
ncbi:DUF4135 domain-containing protein [Rathayibacter toxicus]|nr:DUF4135 domain-containing protein [Rathayibacter toxicus]